MNSQADASTTTTVDAALVAVVCDKRGPDAARMEAYLQSHGIAGRWYAPRDLDEVDSLAAAGKLRRVIVMSWQALLESIWTGEVTYGPWHDAGVQVEFVEPPADGAASALPALSRAWDVYRRKRNRRNAVAGLVLSLIVILAAFAVIWCSHG